MPAKNRPSSRAALVFVTFLLFVISPSSRQPAEANGPQAGQTAALERALRANDLDQARLLIPDNWAASEQLFVSYLERAFLSPESVQPASEPRLLASRLADVFFRIVEYDFARSVVAALDAADAARCQALIAAARDYYAALERERANSVALTTTAGASPLLQRDEAEKRNGVSRQISAGLIEVADRFSALLCPRCELHALRSMANTGRMPQQRVDRVAAQLGDDLSTVRKQPYTEASLAMADRLGLPRLQCSMVESLGMVSWTVTDAAKLQQAVGYLERARVLYRSIPAREQVKYWLHTLVAPRPSTLALPELWRLYQQLGRPARETQQVLTEALELSRPFGEAAVLSTLSAFAFRAAYIGGGTGEPILEASRAFGPKAELATMRMLAGSYYSGRTFRPDAAERALTLAVSIPDARERAVTLEWYATNRALSLKCAPAPASYEQLLQLCLKSDEHGLVAEALAGDAYCRLTGGDEASALAAYGQAIETAERAGPAKAAQVIYGAVTAGPGIPPPVRFELATRGIEYAKKAESPLELARAYRVRSQAPRGATNQSLADLKEALAAAEQHTAQSGLVGEELECLTLLAQEHVMRGEFQEAVDLQRRRAAKALEFDQSWARHVVGADQELARVYSKFLGEPTLALEALERVRQHYEGNVLDETQPASTGGKAAAYVTLGDLAATVGQPVTALEYWDKGLSAAAQVPASSPNSAAYYRRRILTSRAEQYAALGDFDASVGDWDEIGPLIPQTTRNWTAPETVQRARLAADVAWTHALAGNLDKARASALEALAFYRADRSGKWPGLPLTERLSRTLLATNLPEEAITFCEASRELIRREAFEQPVIERWYLEHLAHAHQKAGRRDQARLLLASAVEIDRKQPTAEVGGLGGSLLALGLLEIDARDYARARDYLLEARAAMNPYDMDRVWQIERALAVVNARLGESDAAVQHYDAALTALESARERLRPEEFRLRFGFDRMSLYEELTALLAFKAVQSERPADAELAFQAAERKRAQILRSLLATGWARTPREAMPDQLRRMSELENRISAKQALLAEEFTRPADKRNAALIDGLQRELGQLQGDHTRLLASVAQGQYRFAAPAALAASLVGPVRAALGPSRVLVEYLVADDRSFAFVVSGSGVKVVPLAIGRDGLRKRVEKLLRPFRQLRAGEVDLARLPFDTRAAYELYQSIFAPLRASIGSASEIVIVPDDALTFLPFEALVEQAPRNAAHDQVLHSEFAGEKFLLHRFAISYLPSSAQLLARASEAGRPGQGPRRFFAMANPAAGRTGSVPAPAHDDPLKRQLRSGSFDAFLTPLPGAEAEVQRIARHFPGNTTAIVTGGGATEAAYESQAGQYGIVHFATHAVASDGQPFYSTMILAPDAAPGHDGFLQAFEVLRTPLQADLVVLSGCETALGAEDTGQGLVGLVAAFQQAGAKSVLATLWSIDEAAAEVMANFYGAMAQGASMPAALRQAKLQLLKQRLRIGTTEVSLAHPFFWAPFILVGAPAGR